MICAEFEAALPELLEGSGTAEQRSHLKFCPGCAELVADISFISQQARLLRASDEPSPRVWNSIEIALRQEGLIREPELEAAGVPSGSMRRWTLTWLLPTTAAFLVTFGILRHERTPNSPQIAQHSIAEHSVDTPAIAAAPASRASAVPTAANADTSVESSAEINEDNQLLEVVSTRSPTMRASYETELRDVNQYIRDAERSARANPDDEEAQEYLMDAYEQKAMVYQLAMDRPLQ
jgi:hypothetical protein